MDATQSTRQERPSAVEQNAPFDPPPAGALPHGTQLHEFKLLASLGEGGFSIVYAAHDTQLHRDVAIKEYMPASFASRSGTTQVSLRSERHRTTFEAGLRSFIDEARLLAQFKHRALVEVLRFWEENGTAYMAMPHYSGKTMRRVLKEHDVQCDERWLHSLLAPILDVLELLHSRHIYHRDIAPDNILIQTDGTPVLLDLGSARRVLGDLQQALTVVVKPGYAPIEQYAEDLSIPQGPWTDIYAVGAVLYFAITGQPPAASVSRMMKDTLEPLAKTPREGYSQSFLEAVDHALALQPGDRPQSVADLRQRLGIQDGSWEPVPLAELKPNATSQNALHYVDDGKTVVLSAKEITQLAARMATQLDGPTVDLTPAAARPAPQAAAVELPDPFRQPAPKTQAPNSFPEMHDLMSGQRSSDAGLVSVPRAQPSAEPAAASPTAAPSAGHNWLLTGAALSIVALLLVGGGIWLLRDDPSTTSPTPSAPVTAQNPLPIEAPRPAVVEPAQPVAAVEPTATLEPTQATAPLPTTTPALPNEMPIQVTPPPVADTTGTGFETLSQPAESTPQVTPPEPVRQAPTASAPTPVAEAPEAPEAPEPATSTREAPPAVQAQAQASTARDTPRTPRVSEAAPTAAGGLVNFSILPWGEVWIDGQKRGISPPIKQLELTAGAHQIELRSPGFTTLRRNLTVKLDSTLTLTHDFQQAASSAVVVDTPAATPSASPPTKAASNPPPAATPATTPAAKPTPTPAREKNHHGEVTKGVVGLNIAPWGEIWIDGKKQGVSPPLHELRLPEGEYRIELRNASFPTAVRTVRVSESQRASIRHSFEGAASAQPSQ
ncbi:MAG: protein kinase [Pseudomonas sp.]|uniref:serine/threonine-protein kinase n=1 Tax=Pseudomonas sp. TaxID=306 RepID=UPI0033970222